MILCCGYCFDWIGRFNRMVVVVVVLDRMLLVVVVGIMGLVLGGMLEQAPGGMLVVEHGTVVAGHMELGQRLGSTKPTNFVGISVKK